VEHVASIFRVEESAKQEITMKQAASRTMSCLAYSSALKMELTDSSKCQPILRRLHGIIYKKIELFTTTAMKTLYPIALLFTPYRIITNYPKVLGMMLG
jgi:hypothetical protein